MFRSALLILSGNAAASVLLLARNLIIARLITVEDYGIAATFAIAMAVVEMMSALGLQQQIIQAKDGDDPHFQAALQGFQLLRGVIAGAILFVSAGAIARFLNIPDVAWAYQVMALVPVFNALQHFDIHRLNRQMRFWPVVLTGAVPALLSLALVWPLYLYFGDYQVMLWAIIAQIALMMVVSHLVAERPYRLAFDPAIMKQSLIFGWPILINGVLMFGVFNGDKLIVGRLMGMETLAIFAMGITLTLTPTLVMAKSLNNFFLPQLSKLGGTSDPRFQKLGTVTIEATLFMGLALVVGTVLVGQPLVYALLGEKYAALLPLLTGFAIMQALRVFKAGPAIVAMAVGQTDNAMYANIARIAALPVVWIVAQSTDALIWIIVVGIAAELLSHLIALGLLGWRTRADMRALLAPHLAATVVIIAASLHIALQAQMPEVGLLWQIVAGSAVLALFVLSVIGFPALRAYVRRRQDKTKANA